MLKTIPITLLSFLILGSAISCKPEAKETEEVAATPAPASEEIYLPYPSLGNPIISQLYAETEQVDIILTSMSTWI